MSGFLERLLRQRGEDLKPLERLAQTAGNELYEAGLAQGKEFPGLVKKALRRVKLPTSADGYVFWLLAEEARFWPPMNAKQKDDLQWAITLMDKADATPAVDGDYTLPSEDAESDVEDVILAAAQWASNDLRQSLMQEYKRVLNNHKAEAAKILNTSPEEARGLLSAALLVGIKRKPRWFRDSEFLFWALYPLIP